MMQSVERTVTLVPRPLAGSVDELLDGATRLGAHRPDDARSSAAFERVEVDGERCIVKYVHPEHDFTMRVSGDVGCRPRRVWAAGLMDTAPQRIDHATLGAAPWGRNGWGVALLMRDVSAELVPIGDGPVPEEHHLGFLDAIAALAASLWEWEDTVDLLPHRLRWSWFGAAQLDGEAALGWPEAVPRIAYEGWERFAARAPADVVAAVEELRRDPAPLSTALLETPQTFLHGDWKMGNLGAGSDGRVVLLDWAYPGSGPVCHELAWYLALNRSRLPIGHSKESTILDMRAALERHGIDTDPWWTAQLELCLLGALVQFGWEKAYGDDGELSWWIDAARPGLRRL
jgi:thiamine kinase-like enzyme